MKYVNTVYEIFLALSFLHVLSGITSVFNEQNNIKKLVDFCGMVKDIYWGCSSVWVRYDTYYCVTSTHNCEKYKQCSCLLRLWYDSDEAVVFMKTNLKNLWIKIW